MMKIIIIMVIDKGMMVLRMYNWSSMRNNGHNDNVTRLHASYHYTSIDLSYSR